MRTFSLICTEKLLSQSSQWQLFKDTLSFSFVSERQSYIVVCLYAWIDSVLWINKPAESIVRVVYRLHLLHVCSQLLIVVILYKRCIYSVDLENEVDNEVPQTCILSNDQQRATFLFAKRCLIVCLWGNYIIYGLVIYFKCPLLQHDGHF